MEVLEGRGVCVAVQVQGEGLWVPLGSFSCHPWGPGRAREDVSYAWRGYCWYCRSFWSLLPLRWPRRELLWRPCDGEVASDSLWRQPCPSDQPPPLPQAPAIQCCWAQVKEVWLASLARGQGPRGCKTVSGSWTRRQTKQSKTQKSSVTSLSHPEARTCSGPAS